MNVRRLSVALVIPEFHRRGGTERYMAELARGLAARGHRITIFSARRDLGVLPEARWCWVPMLARPHLVRFLSFVFGCALRRAVARLVREQFDIVHSTGPDVIHSDVATFHCTAAGLGRDVRRSLGDSETVGWLARIRARSNVFAYAVIRLLERYVSAGGAGRVVAVSELVRREIQEGYGADENRIAVIPDGVSLEEFRPAQGDEPVRARAELGLQASAQAVLFVGHNWERKGLETLVRALQISRAEHSGLRPWLLVAGGPTRGADVESARHRLSGEVSFLATRDDMARVYRASDVLVLPTFYEPFGMPVLEAMAAGLPVIVSQDSGVTELLTDGVDALLLKDPADAGELADKLERLLRDRDLRRRIGERARATAERYSWEEITCRTEAIYNELLAERR